VLDEPDRALKMVQQLGASVLVGRIEELRYVVSTHCYLGLELDVLPLELVESLHHL
jgi:hypothetical protein